jgi:hypothetical protein
MCAHKFRAAVVVAVAAAVVTAWAGETAMAQSPPRTPVVAVKKKPATQVTVRKRSFLDPGTETLPGGEHYMDYAHSPNNSSSFTNSTLFSNGASFPIITNRMPFPNCFDLAGFCR